MKKKTLLFSAALLASMTSMAQTWTGNAVKEGEYYLYNVGTGQFFQGGHNWGTNASVGEPGLLVNLIASGNAYKLSTVSTYGGTNGYGDNGFVDNGSPVDITFTPVEGGTNVYTMTFNNGMLGATEKYSVLKKDGTDASLPAYQWMLVSKADRDAAFNAATRENPADASYLIANAATTRNIKGWDLKDATQGGNNNAAGCIESYHINGFKVNQTITLPSGKYEFYSYGFVRHDGNTDSKPVFYVGNKEVLLPERSTEPEANNPNSMDAASNAFDAGYYKTEKITLLNEGFPVEIGWKSSTNDNSDWCIYGRVIALYYGELTVEDLAALMQPRVEEAQALKDKKHDSTLDETLEKVIADYDAITSETTKDALEAISLALNKAVVSLKTSVEAYEAAHNAITAADALAAQMDDSGKSAYDIENIKADYEAGKLDISTYSTSLTAAIRKAAYAQTTSGSDLTLLIDNADFSAGIGKGEAQVSEGWTTELIYSQGNNDLNEKGFANYPIAEKWFGTWVQNTGEGTPGGADGHLKDYMLAQTLKGLSAGKYTLRAYAMATNQAAADRAVEGAFLFAGDNTTVVGDSKVYNVQFELLSNNEDITIGFQTVNTNANWVAIDDITLTLDEHYALGGAAHPYVLKDGSITIDGTGVTDAEGYTYMQYINGPTKSYFAISTSNGVEIICKDNNMTGDSETGYNITVQPNTTYIFKAKLGEITAEKPVTVTYSLVDFPGGVESPVALKTVETANTPVEDNETHKGNAQEYAKDAAGYTYFQYVPKTTGILEIVSENLELESYNKKKNTGTKLATVADTKKQRMLIATDDTVLLRAKIPAKVTVKEGEEDKEVELNDLKFTLTALNYGTNSEPVVLTGAATTFDAKYITEPTQPVYFTYEGEGDLLVYGSPALDFRDANTVFKKADDSKRYIYQQYSGSKLKKFSAASVDPKTSYSVQHSLLTNGVVYTVEEANQWGSAKSINLTPHYIDDETVVRFSYELYANDYSIIFEEKKQEDGSKLNIDTMAVAADNVFTLDYYDYEKYKSSIWDNTTGERHDSIVFAARITEWINGVKYRIQNIKVGVHADKALGAAKSPVALNNEENGVTELDMSMTKQDKDGYTYMTYTVPKDSEINGHAMFYIWAIDSCEVEIGEEVEVEGKDEKELVYTVMQDANDEFQLKQYSGVTVEPGTTIKLRTKLTEESMKTPEGEWDVRNIICGIESREPVITHEYANNGKSTAIVTITTPEDITVDVESITYTITPCEGEEPEVADYEEPFTVTYTREADQKQNEAVLKFVEYNIEATVTYTDGYEVKVSDVIYVLFDQAVGIDGINADENAVIYNVAGQRLNKAVKGINIVGGKKVVKK